MVLLRGQSGGNGWSLQGDRPLFGKVGYATAAAACQLDARSTEFNRLRVSVERYAEDVIQRVIDRDQNPPEEYDAPEWLGESAAIRLTCIPGTRRSASMTVV